MKMAKIKLTKVSRLPLSTAGQRAGNPLVTVIGKKTVAALIFNTTASGFWRTANLGIDDVQ